MQNGNVYIQWKLYILRKRCRLCVRLSLTHLHPTLSLSLPLSLSLSHINHVLTLILPLEIRETQMRTP